MRIGENGAAAYVGKKALDFIVEVVKKRLADRNQTKRRVMILGPNGEPVVEVDVVDEKPKRRRG